MLRVMSAWVSTVQCLPWWAGPFGPFVSLFSFKMVMLTLRFILWDNFIDALFKIKSQVSDKKANLTTVDECTFWCLVNNQIDFKK